MRKYRLVAKKGEGTFSEVLKAQNVKDNKYHAIKCMKNHFESIDQVNNLREIQALRRLSPHQHIVKLEEVLYDQPSGRLALVFELMDANLYEMIRGRRHYLKPELIQSLMYQLCKSLEHMHNKGIFHRDIKPENILVEDSSKLKLADFGSCRGIYSKQPYTEYISTRWYRAPECLLTDGYYGPEMDMWGVGCVFFEITSLYPLFPGSNELDQIHRIHKILGTPPSEVLDIFRRRGAAHIDFNSFSKEEGTTLNKLIPHAPAAAIDLMYKMLAYDPSKRMNAREALRHEYFRTIREQEENDSKQPPLNGQSVASSLQAVLNAGAGAMDLLSQQQQQLLQQQQKLKKQQQKMEESSSHGLSNPLPSIQNGGQQYASTQHDHSSTTSSSYEVDELPPINGSLSKSKAIKNSSQFNGNGTKLGGTTKSNVSSNANASNSVQMNAAVAANGTGGYGYNYMKSTKKTASNGTGSVASSTTSILQGYPSGNPSSYAAVTGAVVAASSSSMIKKSHHQSKSKKNHQPIASIGALGAAPTTFQGAGATDLVPKLRRK